MLILQQGVVDIRKTLLVIFSGPMLAGFEINKDLFNWPLRQQKRHLH